MNEPEVKCDKQKVESCVTMFMSFLSYASSYTYTGPNHNYDDYDPDRPQPTEQEREVWRKDAESIAQAAVDAVMLCIADAKCCPPDGLDSSNSSIDTGTGDQSNSYGVSAGMLEMPKSFGFDTVEQRECLAQPATSCLVSPFSSCERLFGLQLNDVRPL